MIFAGSRVRFTAFLADNLSGQLGHRLPPIPSSILASVCPRNSSQSLPETILASSGLQRRLIVDRIAIDR